MILPSGLDTDAVGRRSEICEHRWAPRDAILYAVGVGAGQENPDSELQFTTENSEGLPQRVLPTFATVIGETGVPPVGKVGLDRLIHAEQSLTLHNEPPVRGSCLASTVVTGIYDKGTSALVRLETLVRDAATDLPYATLGSGIFVRGAGGWGGDAGRSLRWQQPQRRADAIRSYQTGAGQSLIYRLSGDRNPLHSDPSAAAKAGFLRPILHGLCTYGYAGRAVLDACCEGRPDRFGSLSARFTAPVYPGQRLTVSMWNTSTGVLFNVATDVGVVLDRGVFEYRASRP